ncbi:MAG: DNA-binding NarL/FixJ family response regulator [Bacteroidia bacterium]|jgi:DNA-binding NarL/FixJ family response regulator
MKALVVEDEELVRELLASIVSREFEFSYVKEASDGESAWELFQEEKFNFVVLDLMLPKLDGLTLARRILKVSPDVRILAISSECDDYTIREVTRSGILGFVHKQEMSLETLFSAFNEVSAGEIYYSANAQKIIAGMWQDPDAYYKVMSNRELQVLRLIAQGHNLVSAGAILGISQITVRRHKQNVMKRLNIRDEASLVRFAFEKGVVKSKGGLDWTAVSHKKQSTK